MIYLTEKLLNELNASRDQVTWYKSRGLLDGTLPVDHKKSDLRVRDSTDQYPDHTVSFRVEFHPNEDSSTIINNDSGNKYYYDENGNIVSAQIYDTSVTYSYHNNGTMVFVSYETHNERTEVIRQYDNRGNLIKEIYDNDCFVIWVYDDENRVTRIMNGPYTTIYTYKGNRSISTCTNGVKVTTDHNKNGVPRREYIHNPIKGKDIIIEYDNVGNIVAEKTMTLPGDKNIYKW